MTMVLVCLTGQQTNQTWWYLTKTHQLYALVLCYFYRIFFIYSFALSTERNWFDLHFTSDYTLYNLLCDK